MGGKPPIGGKPKGRGYFAECGLRNAESCQGVICGKSSAERSAKYPLSFFRIPQPKNSVFPHHSPWSYLLTT